MTDDSDLSDLSIPVEEVYDNVDGHEVTLCESCNQPMVGTIDVCNECKENFPFDELEALAEKWGQEGHYGDGVDTIKRRRGEKHAEELRDLLKDYR